MKPLECRSCGEVLTRWADTGAYLGDTQGTIIGCYCVICWQWLDMNHRGKLLPSGKGWRPYVKESAA